MFCQNCGAEINDKAVVCIKCGVPVSPIVVMPQKTMSNEWLTTVLLCVFLGSFGIHRFYTKNTGIAIAQLIFGLLSCCVISAIWSLVDLIMLLTGNYKTGNGLILNQNENKGGCYVLH
ncbi:MAG: NINE protein [Kiritimatiellia bacterium]